MAVKIVVSGEKELERRFSKYPPALIKEIEEIIDRGTEDIKNDAKRFAPVKTGFLRDHILKIKRGLLWFEVVSMALYGGFQEYGTSKMRGTPYMRPALAKNIRKIRRDIIQAIKRVIKTV